MAFVERSTPDIYSVAEIIQLVNTHLRSLNTVYVRGSIISIRENSRQQMFIELGDQDNTHEAQIHAWVFDVSTIKKIHRLKLNQGDNIVVRGALVVFRKRASLYLRVDDIELVGTGNLLAEFERIKNYYQSLGYFDPSRKRSIPKFPRCIGVITSITAGIVLADFYSWWKIRYPRARIEVFDCLMQGREASQKIARAIEHFNRQRSVDVILIMRGGGSFSDLWCFNEPPVLEAIFNSQLPVVTAIGHEADVTLADLVADQRAATPTAAANQVLPDRGQLLRLIRDRVGQLLKNDLLERFAEQLVQEDLLLTEKIDELLDKFNNTLETFEKRLALLNPDSVLSERLTRSMEILNRFTFISRAILQRKSESISAMLQKLLKVDSTQKISTSKNLVTLRLSTLTSLVADALTTLQNSVKELETKLIGSSPLEPLNRGFSLILDSENRPVEFKQISVGDEVRALFKDGEINAKILGKHERRDID